MFKNSPFKVIIAIIALLSGMALYAAVNGDLESFPQKIAGALSAPVKSFTSQISYTISAWNDKTFNIGEIIAENEQLKQENKELMDKLVDYDKIKLENESYEEVLGIMEENPQYEMETASVIGRDGLDKYASFTIDVGEKHGVERNDVVISSQGVVGLVIETGYNYSKVSTVLNPSVNVACFVSSTRDTGILNGDSAYSVDGKTLIRYLPKNTKAQEGDIISTSGLGEIFPPDLVVGTIEKVEMDSSGNYSYAVVKPVTDIQDVKTVFVIKSY